MLPIIEGCAASVLSEIDKATTQVVFNDLVALDKATDINPQLRGAMTDTSVPGPVRAAVLADVLKGKVSDVTTQLATYAIRVSPAQDANNALHELAIFVETYHRDGFLPAAPLGLTMSRQRVAGFADARLARLTPADMEQIEDDLFRWARTVESNDELRRLLTDRDVTVNGRQTVVNSLIGGRVHPQALAIAQYVVEGGRARDVVGTLDFLVDHVAKARDWRVATVHAAKELSSAEQAELARALTAMTGHNVDLQIKIDSSLLAGVVVHVGDMRLDATTRGRLQSLKDALAVSRPAVFTVSN